MIGTLEQENFPNPSAASAVYADDPEASIAQPGYTYYRNGVEVNYTAPAKWWNWLWNHITAWLAASKADRTSMQSETLNVLSAASIVPKDTNEHQLSRAIDKVAYHTAEDYRNEEITEEIGGVEVTHKINQPYVVGHTLYIPDTELL